MSEFEEKASKFSVKYAGDVFAQSVQIVNNIHLLLSQMSLRSTDRNLWSPNLPYEVFVDSSGKKQIIHILPQNDQGNSDESAEHTGQREVVNPSTEALHEERLFRTLNMTVENNNEFFAETWDKIRLLNTNEKMHFFRDNSMAWRYMQSFPSSHWFFAFVFPTSSQHHVVWSEGESYRSFWDNELRHESRTLILVRLFLSRDGPLETLYPETISSEENEELLSAAIHSASRLFSPGCGMCSRLARRVYTLMHQAVVDTEEEGKTYKCPFRRQMFESRVDDQSDTHFGMANYIFWSVIQHTFNPDSSDAGKVPIYARSLYTMFRKSADEIEHAMYTFIREFLIDIEQIRRAEEVCWANIFQFLPWDDFMLRLFGQEDRLKRIVDALEATKKDDDEDVPYYYHFLRELYSFVYHFTRGNETVQ